jgi:hypothetical protein
MADRELLVPENIESDGTLLLLAAPRSAFTTWPPTAAQLNAATTKDITYSLTSSGWNHGKAQETTTDDRLTLREVLAKPGRITHTVEVQYFYGSEEDVVDPLFVEGADIVIGARYAVPYEEAVTATDKFDFLELECGAKRRDQPSANGRWTKTQALHPRGKVLEDVVIA